MIPTEEFFRHFSANTGSSEVRVSDRAAPLQLTWIQGLAREHFSRADACQHGHRVWVIQWKYSLLDLEVRGFQILKSPWESPAKWSGWSLISHFKYKLTDYCFIFPPNKSLVLFTCQNLFSKHSLGQNLRIRPSMFNVTLLLNGTCYLKLSEYEQPRPGEATFPGMAAQNNNKKTTTSYTGSLLLIRTDCWWGTKGFSNNGCDYLEPQNPFPPA